MFEEDLVVLRGEEDYKSMSNFIIVPKNSYLLTLENNKQLIQNQLASIIEKNKGQVVGDGYADIILPCEYYINFVNDLTDINLGIEAISWWCHCTPENEKLFGCPHGYGGPKSKYSDGWYSERCHDFDEIDPKDIEELDSYYNNDIVKKINGRVIDIIKNKRTVTYGDGSFQIFEKDQCLTPGFWLHVPKNWKSC